MRNRTGLPPTIRRPWRATSLWLAAAIALPNGGAPASLAAASPAFVASGAEAVAPGVAHQWGSAEFGGETGSQAVNLVDVTPGTPGIGFAAALSGDQATGRATTTQMARAIGGDERQAIGGDERQAIGGDQRRAIVAVNADAWGDGDGPTFDPPNGYHVQGGELMVAGSRLRGTFGVDAAGGVHIGDPRITLTLRLPSGVDYPIARLNQRRRPGELVLYTGRFDDRTGTEAGGSEVAVMVDGLPLRVAGAWDATVTGAASSHGNAAIPLNGAVLSGTGGAAAVLDTLLPEDRLVVESHIDPGWEDVVEAVGGRQVLVREGRALPGTGTDATSQSPRTAIGVTGAGRVIVVTVDGRQPGWSDGVGIDDLGQLLRSLGATEALSMDGGGSSTLAVRRPGDAAVSIVNRVSDPRERPVTNALAIVSTIPVGPLAALAVRLPERLAVGATAPLDAVGIDAGGNPLGSFAWQARWETSGPGALTALALEGTAPGTVTLTARAGTIAGSASTEVVPDTAPPTLRAPGVTLALGPAPPSATIAAWASWVPAVDVGVGVARYELQRRDGVGPWRPLATTRPDVRSVTILLDEGGVAQIRVRAIDAAGNASRWRAGDALRPRRVAATDRQLDYAGSWTAEPPRHADGETWMTTAEPGASMSYRTDAFAVAMISTRGPFMGAVEVSADGELQGGVDLFAPADAGPVAVDQLTGDGATRVTFEWRAAGTRWRERIRIVALLVIEPAGSSRAAAKGSSNVDKLVSPTRY